nr:MFS transporter [Sphingomonas sp. Y57]
MPGAAVSSRGGDAASAIFAHVSAPMTGDHYRKYMLAVLLMISASSYVDRIALGLVLQDIKLEFDLSDTQLGVLTGIAFALFYSLMGIPIARWADQGNRVTIISLTTALWSAALAACTMAGSFAQLLLIRIGVAVGEAGCIPPAHSLIADHYSRDERPRAVSIYMMGAPLSLVVGYFLAGWLNELYGWRTMFLILGLPGIGLAALARFTLREPRRARASTPRPQGLPSGDMPRDELRPGIGEVFRALWLNTTFRHLLVAFALTSFFAGGVGQWSPAFFIRTHGFETSELGMWLAIAHGGGGLAGVLWGGEIATRIAPSDEKKQLRAIGLSYCAFSVVTALIYMSPSYVLAFTFMALASFGAWLATGPLFSTIQTLVPAPMRATSIALLYLFANLIGMGLGPLATGMLSDALHPVFGSESLRYALLALCPGYLWGAWYIWRASSTVERDILKAAGAEAILPAGDAPDAIAR